jgi:short subunit fatty acids transporter
MHYTISQILFWLYWGIALMTAVLLVREALKSSDWRTQAGAALAVIPFLLRVFLVK